MSKAGKDLLWSCFFALCFVLLYGYTFNCSDQEEHLPQVYKLLNPALYRGDYFVEAASDHFTVRHFYVKVVYQLSLLLGVEYSSFILYILCMWFSFYFILKITSHFFLENKTALIAAALTPLLFNKFTTGGNYFFDTQLICTTIATPFCLGGIFFFLKKDWLKAGALCGIACLFQVLMGLQVFMLFALVTLLTEKKTDWKTIGKSVLVFAVVSLPMLYHILANQFGSSSFDQNIFYEALYSFRNPHHYLPSQFPFTDYLKTIFLIGLSVSLCALTKNAYTKWLVCLNITVILLLLFYFLSFEIFKWMVAGKMQLFKIMLWLGLLNGIFVVAVTTTLIGRKTTIKFYNNRFETIISAGSIILLLFIINLKNYFPDKISRRYNINSNYKSDLTLAHDWIKQNTDVKSVIMSFPSDNSLLCEAQRPVFTAFKAIIHEPWFLNNWMQTFKQAYEITDVFTFKNPFNLEHIENNNYINGFTRPKVDYYIVKNNYDTAKAIVVYRNKTFAILQNLRQ